MVTCPVCEHQQPHGFECEVCGKDLGGLASLGPPPVRDEPLPGLEPSLATPVGEVPVEPLAGLELTSRAGEVPAEVVVGLEATRQAPVGEVALEPFPDLAPDRTPDDGVRTALPTDRVVCRYCRQEQPPAALCVRCGMSLPRVAEAVLVATAVEVPVVRCRSCGTRGPAGQPCSGCGIPLASP